MSDSAPKVRVHKIVAILKNGPLHKQRVRIRPGQRQYLALRPGHPGEFATYFLYGMADGRVFGLIEGLILKAISTTWTMVEMAQAKEGVLQKATRQTHRDTMDRDGGLLLYFCVTSREDTETMHMYYTVGAVR